jgi:DNA-binding transcriptional LysR family regulator
MNKLTQYFRELQYLKVVIEHGSINRAASQVGLSQPALTRSIGRLEAALGVQLLNRSARGIFPTAYGDALMLHLKLIDSELQRAGSELEALQQGNGGQITCGGTIGAISWLFAESIDLFTRRRPKLRIRVLEGIPSTLLALLRSGEVDVVVCTKVDDTVESDLAGESIGSDRVGLFVGKGSRLLRKSFRSLKDINAAALWILPNWSGEFYRLIRRKFAAESIAFPSSAIETSSTTLVKSILRSNDRAVAISTAHLMDAEILDGTIQEIQGDWSLFTSNTMIYRRANVITPPLVEQLVQCIKSTARSRSEA